MAKIRIRRKNQWTNRARSFGIYVDGNKIGQVRNGKSEEFEVPGSVLQVKAKVDWCGSNEISLAGGETETHNLVVGSYKFADLIVVVELLILVTHFILSFNYGINYVIFFAVPTFPGRALLYHHREEPLSSA